MKNKMILVYNANSGVGSSLMDIAHKAISPSTYSCALCSLTHGVFSAKEEWSEFINERGVEIEIMHKDEFETKYNAKLEYPVILYADSMRPIFTSDEIEELSSTTDLINRLNEVLK